MADGNGPRIDAVPSMRVSVRGYRARKSPVQCLLVFVLMLGIVTLVVMLVKSLGVIVLILVMIFVTVLSPYREGLDR